MKLIDVVGIGGIALTAGCAGVQTGEGGEEDGPCIRREVEVEDLSAIPEGFTDSPQALLSPIAGRLLGSLQLTGGASIPLEMTPSQDPGTAKAVYFDLAPGKEAVCNAPGITIQANALLDGGSDLTGTVRLEIDTLSGKLNFYTLRRSINDVQTTLVPSFAHTPTAAPTLVVGAEYDNGLWSGDWTWEALVDCAGDENCSGMERQSLGSVELKPTKE